MSLNDFLTKLGSFYEEYSIKVSFSDMAFIRARSMNQSFETLEKLYKLLEDQIEANPKGNWTIALPRYYEVTVKENIALRKDKLGSAQRALILAKIGEFKQCTEARAEEILGNVKLWDDLPQSIKDDITALFFTISDNEPETLPIRQVTCLIQNRLIDNWTYDDTLNIPMGLCGQFLAYLETEKTGKPKTDSDVIEVEAMSLGTSNIVNSQRV